MEGYEKSFQHLHYLLIYSY